MQTDRRLLPANDHVAASELRGVVEAPRYDEGAWHRVQVPVADLLRAPGGPRERQLLYGQRVRVFDMRDGHAFLQSERDGFVGYLDTAALGTDAQPTHRVHTAATHLYPAPDLKRIEICGLSHGALLTITGTAGDYLQTDAGHFVPSGHVSPVEARDDDPVAIAELYLGTPYLWGGNSRAGIDCSGLVQAALLACGIPCPGDSDLQEQALGGSLPEGTPARRGDLFFWKGHVAMAVDEARIIHANARAMAVSFEPLQSAIARIEAAGDGPPTSHRRLG
ncbi:NlpC/P60 family protein [Tropicimonas sediminicola]|uniref:NlpC/P60 family protein n=1 Tax=Tropicimonas sediminicola TaxID=1031541 RepID=A0A239L425_9RHOB|nr:NlpC/P60 family protein [Tropicimonas sediminicola]SNT25060.1 NlpC/P60 family protein [Tropicimonas sediminicola]